MSVYPHLRINPAPLVKNLFLYRACCKIEFHTRRRPEFKPDRVGSEAVQIE